jgi:hypothetical protein
MSTRQGALDVLMRHLVTFDLFCKLSGLQRKNAERILGLLQRDKLVRSLPYTGGKKLYTLTAVGARKLGLDERRYRRAPGSQARIERLTLAMFCAQEGHRALTVPEFTELLPEQAACPGAFKQRYFVDKKRDSLLTVIVPDMGTPARRCARRARREIDRRRPHQAWRDLIYHKLLQVVVVTAFGTKAEAIRAHLEHDTFPNAVVVVDGLEDLQ